MGVWKRLQRIGKNASKFEFNISYYELTLKCSKSKWFPHKLCVNWTRRSRDIRTQLHDWVPSLDDPCVGQVDWRVPENVTSSITLYRGQRDEEFEDKDWSFNIESVDKSGKRKIVATTKVNMKSYATVSPTPQVVELKLKSCSDKFVFAELSFMISCSLLKEGLATDDDMISMASLMSYGSAADNNTDDVGNLADFDDLGSATESFASFTAQMGSFINMADNLDLLDVDQQVSELSISGSPNEHSSIKPMYIGTPPLSPPISRKDDSTKANNLAITIDENNVENLTKGANTSPPLYNFEPQTHSTNASDDLLTWAQGITNSYKGIRVTNFTTSWRNGMAFCAIIHYYRNDLIDMDSLSPREIKQNNKAAFDAAELIGIPRIIEPADMVVMKVPDKLQVKTYLHELRTHFTGHKIEQKTCQKPADFSLASYIFGHLDYEPKKSAISEIKGQDIHKIRPTRQLSTDWTVELVNDEELSLTRDLQPVQKVKASSYIEDTLDNVLENAELSAKQSNTTVCSKQENSTTKTTDTSLASSHLMTRKELLNPFDSDEDDADPYADLMIKPDNSAVKEPSPKPELVESSKDTSTSPVIEKSYEGEFNNVSQLDDTTQPPVQSTIQNPPAVSTQHSTINSKKPVDCSEQRYEELRARARKLIEQARCKQKKPANVSSDSSSSMYNQERCDTGSHIYDVNEYVYMELAGIERDQEELDKYAAKIEIQLRRAMNEGDQRKEDFLTEQWFLLVNRKNALIRRQEQLNILEKEENLNIRHDLLKRELRHIMSLEEWEKSTFQKEKEQKLLDELVSVVNKKDALVAQIEQQQLSLDEDEAMEKQLRGTLRPSNVDNKQCSIQ